MVDWRWEMGDWEEAVTKAMTGGITWAIRATHASPLQLPY